MLTNYYSISQETSVSAFLKEMNDKKNMNYIVLDTSPKSIIDIRTLSTKIHNQDEKLKNLKRVMPWTKSENEEELLKFLIESGENVIENPSGFYDFLDGLKTILSENKTYLDTQLKEIAPKEIYALNPKDKISTAKNMFLTKKINILPVIEDMEIIGEVRTNDLLSSELFQKNESKEYFNENYENSVFSLGIENIMNSKPHTINSESTLKDAIKLITTKKLPSLLVEKENKIYSIVSYKDIFKIQKQEYSKQEFEINLVGEDALFDDELNLVKGFAFKTMRKISKISNYTNLKIHFKLHGDKDSGHMRKGELKLTLDAGGKVISISKDIQEKETNWNLTKLTQDSLKVLENKVKESKN